MDLVSLNPTSTRLRNTISSASIAGSLPVQRLSEYLSAANGIEEVLLRSVANFGRKTAVELDKLMHTAGLQRRRGADNPQSIRINELRESICDCFPVRTVSESFVNRGIQYDLNVD